MIELVTWNIDCSLYTIGQLERLAEIVYEMDCSVGNQLYDAIEEKYRKSSIYYVEDI